MTTSNKKKRRKKKNKIDLRAFAKALKHRVIMSPHYTVDGKIDKDGTLVLDLASYHDESTVYTAVVHETPHELDLLIRELVSWRSVGHQFSCLCHNCIPLREKITARGDDGLYLADRYPLRYGAELGKPTCRHDISLMADCARCAQIWEFGAEKPFPYCYSSTDGGPRVKRTVEETATTSTKEKV